MEDGRRSVAPDPAIRLSPLYLNTAATSVVYLKKSRARIRRPFERAGHSLPRRTFPCAVSFSRSPFAGWRGRPRCAAQGLLIPTERGLPPLRLAYERVEVAIVGQVATTKVEQSYRNTTDRDLEAEYIFPLPSGASVRDFSMWVGGKRYKGEAVDAKAARQTYEDIVRRLQDPGLLEYIGRDLWKVRIYPVPRRGEQKIEITFTSILPAEGDMISYQYLLRTGQTVRTTEKDFTMVVRIQSQDPLGPIYSPSHDVEVVRRGDRDAIVSFERNRCQLDKDFQLYFAPKAERVGFSLIDPARVARRSRLFPALVEPKRSGPVETRTSRPRPCGRYILEHGRREATAGQGRLEAHARLARAGRPIRLDIVRDHPDLVPRRALADSQARPPFRARLGR